MEKIQQIKFNIFLFTIAVLAVFVALINLNRTYKAETELLLIARNEATAKGMDKIIEDAMIIPKTLSFYDRIISEGIEDPAQELPGYKREDYWKTKVRTEKIAGSNMIQITIFDKDQFSAEEISQQSALSEAQVLSQYYNIETELDTRIVNGPTVSYGLKTNGFILFLESLLGGIIFAVSVNIISYILELAGIGSKKGKAVSIVSKYQMPQIMKVQEEKPIAFDKRPADFKKPQEKNISTEKTVAGVPAGKKAAAPDNLPIADESIFKIAAKKTEPAILEKESEGPVIREATPEEVKERLNKLLKGGF
jgi:capsular polysaccharide biosynthesis protein